MPDVIDKHGTKLTLGLAAVLAPAIPLLHLSRAAIVVGLISIGALAMLVQYRSDSRRENANTPQPQIDHEYRLSIDGTHVTLFRNQTVATQFRWHELLEVQLVSRHKGPSPQFWKLTTVDGDFFIPSGVDCSREFETQLIHNLPGYYEQRTLTAPAPEGYERALSMWRKDDPHPKREVTDDDEW
jgi:hypothetical protein